MEIQNDDNTWDTRMVKVKDIYQAFDAKDNHQYLMAPELRNSFLIIKLKKCRWETSLLNPILNSNLSNYLPRFIQIVELNPLQFCKLQLKSCGNRHWTIKVGAPNYSLFFRVAIIMYYLPSNLWNPDLLSRYNDRVCSMFKNLGVISQIESSMYDCMKF